MKKLYACLLSLALLAGTAVFAQDAPKTEEKKEAKKTAKVPKEKKAKTKKEKKEKPTTEEKKAS